jgi:hypothetical protein
MGRVEGVIAWQGKPLKNAKVKIVLESYTGFSIAALKKMLLKCRGSRSASQERAPHNRRA